MKELTKAEEQVMIYLWKLEKAFVKEILEQFPEPKPAYNTVSTIIRVLEKKGFIDHEQFGKTHRYFTLFTKKEYAKLRFRDVYIKNFSSSFLRFASFFTKENDLNVSELEELKKMIETELKDKKGNSDTFS